MLYEGFFVILYKKKRILMKRKKLKKLNLNKKTITNFKETIKGGTLNKTEDEITETYGGWSECNTCDMSCLVGCTFDCA